MKDSSPVSTYSVSMFSCSSSLLTVDCHSDGFITVETDIGGLFPLLNIIFWGEI
jgi:hypothetical protein